jgi:hypothetical protein
VPQTEAQRKGASFEEAVIKGTDEELFDAGILAQVRALLPRPMMKTQVYCEYQLGNVLLYGYVDVLGRMLAVDIKTTKKYEPGCYAKVTKTSICLHYAPKALKACVTLSPILRKCTTRNTIKEQISRFCEFLETYRDRITDLRVFARI